MLIRPWPCWMAFFGSMGEGTGGPLPPGMGAHSRLMDGQRFFLWSGFLRHCAYRLRHCTCHNPDLVIVCQISLLFFSSLSFLLPPSHFVGQWGNPSWWHTAPHAALGEVT